MRRVAQAAGIVGAALLLLLLARPSAEEATHNIAMPATVPTVACLELLSQSLTRHSQKHQRHTLFRQVAEMPARITELASLHLHDADGQWPADAVFELGQMQRTLGEARCFAHGSSMTHVAETANRLAPLLAHAGLLGRANRTGIRPHRVLALPERQRGAEPARRPEHAADLRDIHDTDGAHPALGYAYA